MKIVLKFIIWIFITFHRFYMLLQTIDREITCVCVCIYFKMSRSMKRFVFFRIYIFILFLHTCMFPTWYFLQKTCMAQGLVNGYSMRLELIRVCSLNGFQLVFVLFMKVAPFFFLECVSLSLLYPSFTFYIWYSVCVCVCVCIC